MAHRGGESAMDFQYDNQIGQVDAQSPFVRYAHDNKLRGSSAAKRDYSSLNSSSQFPSLRDPASSHSFLFSQPSPSRPISALPPHMNTNSPAFQTPQKPKFSFDSSDAESSPDNCNADSEASPIDRSSSNMGLRSALSKSASRAMTKFVGTENSDKENNKDIFQSAPQASPGKGDMTPRGAYSRRVEKRVQTRSSKKLGFLSRKSSASSDTDTQAGKKSSSVDETAGGVGLSIAGFFRFLHEYPNLPHILSFYAQLVLNCFFVGIVIYSVWSFWMAVQTDVNGKAAAIAKGVMAEMLTCAEDFRKNRCDSRDRAPALDAICNNWKSCMDQDPMVVGRAKVTAGTFAEILNSFVEPITWKAFGFTAILFSITVLSSNIGFSILRNKTAPHHQPPMNQGGHYGYHEPTPSTPRHHGMYPPQDGYYSAAQSPYQASPSKQQLGMSSPTRRIQYH